MFMFLLACFLFLACAALVLAEVFIPSGGLISVMAIACVVGGIIVCFNISAFWGWVGIIAAIIMIPSVLIIAYKLLPKTRFGKNVTLAPPERQQGDAVPDTIKLKEMIGAIGTVVTPLRPVGMCNFSGQRLECVAESGYVDKDKKVKVIKIESTQLTVRVIDENS
jgi:membrane-bound ClpP family serine protease